MSNPFQMVRGEFYERHEDMSPEGRLRVLMQEDGDVILTAMEPDREGRLTTATVEFCTSGGRSPRTRAALIELARAIAEDNGGKPSLD